MRTEYGFSSLWLFDLAHSLSDVVSLNLVAFCFFFLSFVSFCILGIEVKVNNQSKSREQNELVLGRQLCECIYLLVCNTVGNDLWLSTKMPFLDTCIEVSDKKPRFKTLFPIIQRLLRWFIWCFFSVFSGGGKYNIYWVHTKTHTHTNHTWMIMIILKWIMIRATWSYHM